MYPATQQFIEFNGYQLHYRSYGNGSMPLLAFHGFNRTGADWESFAKYLGDTFTIYAFDIFYHGKSIIDENIDEPYIGKMQLCVMIERFMIANNFSRVSLIGYSLGGKLVLCLMEVMPGQIENAFVMAPDGVKLGFWNSFISRSFLGKIIFNHVVKDPKYVLKISGSLEKTGLIHKKLAMFLRSQLTDPQQRERVLNIWSLFKDLVPDNRQVRKHIGRYQINFQMFFGKYDAIIPLKSGLEFSEQLKKPTLHVMDCGHNMSGVVYEICAVIKQSIEVKSILRN